MDCIFCKIVNGEIPSKKLYEDEQVLAFYDIEPKAPVHVLVIPKQHLDSVLAVNEENVGVVAHIFALIPKLQLRRGRRANRAAPALPHPRR